MYYEIKESGTRIQKLRMKCGYTQDEVAKTLNIDRSYLSRIESGKNGCSVDLLIQFSRLFDISIDYIILGEKGYGFWADKRKAELKSDIEQLVDRLKEFKLRL